jgi:hypothetical protein
MHRTMVCFLKTAAGQYLLCIMSSSGKQEHNLLTFPEQLMHWIDLRKMVSPCSYIPHFRQIMLKYTRFVYIHTFSMRSSTLNLVSNPQCCILCRGLSPIQACHSLKHYKDDPLTYRSSFLFSVDIFFGYILTCKSNLNILICVTINLNRRSHY